MGGSETSFGDESYGFSLLFPVRKVKRAIESSKPVGLMLNKTLSLSFFQKNEEAYETPQINRELEIGSSSWRKPM